MLGLDDQISVEIPRVTDDEESDNQKSVEIAGVQQVQPNDQNSGAIPGVQRLWDNEESSVIPGVQQLWEDGSILHPRPLVARK